MAKKKVVYGLFEVFATTCNESLTSVRIHHDLFIARDEEDAQRVAQERAPEFTEFTITRLADSTPRAG